MQSLWWAGKSSTRLFMRDIEAKWIEVEAASPVMGLEKRLFGPLPKEGWHHLPFTSRVLPDPGDITQGFPV